jgi:hypothetical protein
MLGCVLALDTATGCSGKDPCEGQVPRPTSSLVDVGVPTPVTIHTNGTYAGQLDFAGIVLTTSDTLPSARRDQEVDATAVLLQDAAPGSSTEPSTSAEVKVTLGDGTVLTYRGPVGSDCVN